MKNGKIDLDILKSVIKSFKTENGRKHFPKSYKTVQQRYYRARKRYLEKKGDEVMLYVKMRCVEFLMLNYFIIKAALELDEE
ncbi:MAG: hypothetical protein IJX03_06605 [Clostridia bacterium]|nr:hypothetical protein [Clostridia bacterium]